MIYYYLYLVYKDESNTVSGQSTVTTSVINLKLSPPTPSRHTETLHHHHHQPYRKAVGKSTLNKTDEHCRSLFNLLPISLRPRHLNQTSNNKGVDASTTTTTQVSPSIDRFGTDYDSGYMSQSILNRTPSYASCYSAVATTVPIPSINRHESIESLLHGHSKSNPANIRVLVRKNFESFAQAHISVTKGTIVTALFARGPWLYIRVESNGQTGYIPRIICSLYKNHMITHEKNYYQHHRYNLSISSTESVSNKDDELDLTVISKHDNKYFIHPYKQQQMNRYLSYSSTIINDQQKPKDYSKNHLTQTNLIERERRNTCTLPPPVPLPVSSLSSTLKSSKDRRLTVNSINWSMTNNNSDIVGIHQMNDGSTIINNGELPPQRDTDSSSTQDSGYSESTPYFLVQQITSDTESIPTLINTSKKSNLSPHYATVRHTTLLKNVETTNTYDSSLRRHNQQTTRSNRPPQYRHTLVNGLSINTMLTNDINKRHSFGAFYINDNENYEQPITKSIDLVNNSISLRSNEYALIRNIRHDKDNIYQQIKPTIHNLPESHQQIPASIFLHHHRQQHKQQFGSSHSAFRPVQPSTKSKRASSEGHSPSSEHHISSPAISISSSSSLTSSSNSSISKRKKIHSLKQRRLSCDLPIPIVTCINSNSLTRSVCDQTSTKKLNDISRTMSDILCDQFSEINLDAIEKDSLAQPIAHKTTEQKMKKNVNIQQNLYTITKDYRSSRASFSVKRGDYVHIIKQVGRACFLVRKYSNGQTGFLPKALMIPTTTSKVDTFLEMHGYRETVI
ncbi:unnamed protein product [Rotaria sp. Silwood1]|nr:unnamed protein product [Rotaria sp. Silwood1]CAF1070269.1 unnamed protein product [Rotaria sp. Silwood1]CAF3421042.1 unnamed protein product [Rotaria sp. Silwood1]CAF4617934.1 unnamed protein product [Rotaria sp. Silwood1]